MSYRNRQRTLAVGCLAIAIVIASFSGPIAMFALPASALVFGWPFARFALWPARQQFKAERAGTRPVQRRPNLTINIAAGLGIALASILGQFGSTVAAGAIAQMMVAFAASLFFVSLFDRE